MLQENKTEHSCIYTVIVKEAHLVSCTISKTKDKAEDCSSCSIQLKVDDMAVQVAPGGYVITSTREDSF